MKRNLFGDKNPFFGKKHSKESKLKISLAQIGRVSPKKGKKYPHTCKPHPSMKGSIPPNKGKKGLQVAWNKGLTKETNPILKRCAERPRSVEILQHMRDAVKGSKSWNWQGGRTPLSKLIRRSLEFKKWREEIFGRNNWICQQCFNKGGDLHPHHLKSFSKILQEFLQEYSQFSPIEDKETLARLAISYKPFWEVENGTTLCKDCHKDTHKLWRKNALVKNN